ncbi:uncharacterized protein LOC141798731 [Halichoeres trimaculatus]|uniref:uncharacterized protein LOC141798731 n=1 Tax=Halichoeres trimaculatus TaxID=147232 RepID=UPI003D9EBBEF
MFQKVLLIKILLVHYSIQNLTEIQAECGRDVTLRCPGVDRMDFLAVAWYKIHKVGNSSGIVRRDKNDDVRVYNFPRPAVFGDNHGLFLSKVKPEDSGVYECDISAVLGEKNQSPKVNLTVGECPTQAELTTTSGAPNSTHPNSHKQEEDLPVVWSITGVVLLGLVKILLSLISILVNTLKPVRDLEADMVRLIDL